MRFVLSYGYRPMEAREWNVVVFIGLAPVESCVSAHLGGDLVGVGVAQLEEVCHYGVGFEVSNVEIQALSGCLQNPVSFCSLWIKMSELAGPFLAPCLLRRRPASHHDDNGVNFIAGLSRPSSFQE